MQTISDDGAMRWRKKRQVAKKGPRGDGTGDLLAPKKVADRVDSLKLMSQVGLEVDLHGGRG